MTALPGALPKAGSARRLAGLRLAGLGGSAAVAVVTGDEVASHELLLATVPASVLRSFRERLLGPLLAYDDQHRAELLPHAAGVPSLLRFVERVRGQDVRSRQHRPLPDQADRGADRA